MKKSVQTYKLNTYLENVYSRLNFHLIFFKKTRNKFLIFLSFSIYVLTNCLSFLGAARNILIVFRVTTVACLLTTNIFHVCAHTQCFVWDFIFHSSLLFFHNVNKYVTTMSFYLQRFLHFKQRIYYQHISLESRGIKQE